MNKSMRIAITALAISWAAAGAAVATPMTQLIGTSTILGNTYDVSVLYDPSGSNSFNNLLPTITFTTLADAITAGDQLNSQFGTSFDWNPFTSLTGGRIAYNVAASTYDYVTLCVTELNCGVVGVNGPFTLGRDITNGFTFIQFAQVSPVSAVPEPLTLSLFGVGVGGLVVARRKRKKAA